MIDLIPLRTRLEKTLRDLTVLEHDLRDLAPATVEAVGREVSAAGTGQRAEASDASGKPPVGPGGHICAGCGAPFVPNPRVAHRARFCSTKCRVRAAAKAARERKAANGVGDPVGELRRRYHHGANP